MNILEDVKLDKNNLAEEDVQFAETYYYYAKELGAAKSNLDTAKTNLSATKGRRELAIRKSPGTDLKITESVISALVDSDTEVMAAEQDVDAAQEKVNLLFAAVMAMNEKSSRLKELISLDNRNYYNSVAPSDDMHGRLK